jgi:hypothetical protein
MLKRQANRFLVSIDREEICAFTGTFSFLWFFILCEWRSPSSCIITPDRVFYLDDFRTIAMLISLRAPNLVEASYWAAHFVPKISQDLCAIRLNIPLACNFGATYGRHSPTPASTLVISNTLMPDNGRVSTSFPRLTEANRLLIKCRALGL